MEARIDDIMRKVVDKLEAKKLAAEEEKRLKIERHKMIASSLEDFLRNTVLPALNSCRKTIESYGFKAEIEEINKPDYVVGDGLSRLIAVKLKVSTTPGDNGLLNKEIEFQGNFDEETFLCKMMTGDTPGTSSGPFPYSEAVEDFLALRLESFIEQVFKVQGEW
ncbi:hypothetical protein [Desulfogranum japonicum]|uniref:hypothetical protein n=1 Tax=Desulfogranum japonicum TaxID=231447 RepID=UPI0004253B48|nr:hypothetical protein [Desulfogranum japonicum]